jgi:hypothetical protein
VEVSKALVLVRSGRQEKADPRAWNTRFVELPQDWQSKRADRCDAVDAGDQNHGRPSPASQVAKARTDWMLERRPDQGRRRFGGTNLSGQRARQVDAPKKGGDERHLLGTVPNVAHPIPPATNRRPRT